eukprot:scaffold133215_cov26-Tisochrysis_lutea.AAC.1
MGSVFLARRRCDRRRLALKTVPLLSEHDRHLATNEISILKKLSHSHIVTLYDAFTHADEVVLVMEYCEGGDLADLIAATKKREGGSIPNPHVEAVGCQLASALSHVHGLHVVHRDIKASNVFIKAGGKDGEAPGVMLGDFGVAKTLESTKAMACTQCGTPYYLPPEVCNGANYNTKADMWSLGRRPQRPGARACTRPVFPHYRQPAHPLADAPPSGAQGCCCTSYVRFATRSPRKRCLHL